MTARLLRLSNMFQSPEILNPMLVTRARSLAGRTPFVRTAEVATWTHRLNDRNAAFVCRYAGPRRRPDVLSEMLRAVRLTGSVFFNGSFTAPFRDREPEALRRAHAAGAPAPHQHLPSGRAGPLHVRDGHADNAATIGPGDMLLMPFADAHKFWAGDTTETAYVPDLVQPGPIEGMLTAQLRRRRRGDAPGLRLSRIVGIPVCAGVPHPAGAAGRADRRGPDRRGDRLDRARDHRARRRGNTGLATHARAG